MNSRPVTYILAAMLALASTTASSGQVTPPSQTSEKSLSEGQALLKAGKVSQSIKLLERARNQSPTDAVVLVTLGKAYKEAHQYEKARNALKQAWRAARGTATATAANQELLTLPENLQAPRAKRVVARMRGRRIAAAGLVRVKLIAFTASWAEPCKRLNAAIEKARTEWGDKVELVSVDVDDPKNDYLLEQYDVAPVPTVVFLDQEGKMVSYLVGYSGEAALYQRIKALTSGTKADGSTG